jgi:hypothetical protein
MAQKGENSQRDSLSFSIIWNLSLLDNMNLLSEKE